MILVIVESPSKCKKIESYLGSGYKCVASFGHICEFKDGLKSIDKNYNPTFKICKEKMVAWLLLMIILNMTSFLSDFYLNFNKICSMAFVDDNY